MKRGAHHPAISIATLSLALVITLIPALVGEGQQTSQTTVKRTLLKTGPASSGDSLSKSALASAVEQNATLRNSLKWTFGGKPQHGWYLYDSLIGQVIKTPLAPETGEFAAALAAWQKEMGLNPSGVLDEDSLMALVSLWQSYRLKDRSLAEPEQLTTAPATDFFDPERLVELRQIERNTYKAYKELVAAAIADPSLHLGHSGKAELAADEKYFKIISSFRSKEYQEKLRRESPNAGRAGLAVNSPHFTGRALDIYVGGDPVDTRDSNRAIQVRTPAYQWLVQNAERFGFHPYFYEPWHWEYVR